MRICTFLLTGLVLGALLACSAPIIFPTHKLTYNLGDITGWRPTPEEIVRAVGGPSAGTIADNRHKTFVTMFKKRFRDHDAGVGLKFLEPNRLQVMCAAMMPRSDMIRVAEAAYSESKALFGVEFVLEIFKSTAAGSEKLGEAKAEKVGGSLKFDFSPRYARPVKPLTADQVVDALEKDAVPAIVAPVFVSARKARIEPRTRVIGISHGKSVHAYSINLLNTHEIVNDSIADRGIIVSWCSRCRTACVFEREVAGRQLTFGMSGKLWNNAMVMYDHQTNSLWSQVTGEAISGRYKGHHLRMVACMPQVDWKEWKRFHPETSVLSVDGKQDAPRDPRPIHFVSFGQRGLLRVPHPDLRAAADAMVLGVASIPNAAAFTHETLEAKKLISGAVGTMPILVCMNTNSGATAVYHSPGPGTYRVDGDEIVGEDNRWEMLTGKPIGDGSPLVPIPHKNAYWFAWSSFYPKTTLYQ